MFVDSWINISAKLSFEGWIGIGVSIALFILGSIILPIVVYKYKKRKERMEENSTKNDVLDLILNKTYTSLFAEENKLKTEIITITKQSKKHKIWGKVVLIESTSDNQEKKYTYNLKGTFANKIITAEYSSVSKTADERGTINLKLVDTDVFSGFCSFSKIATSEDEIRVSPYIWVAGENKDLLNGSFDFCASCHKENLSCCCMSDLVDMPIFMSSELELIRSNLQSAAREKSKFSKEIAKSNLRQMKDTQSATTQSQKCYFFQENNNQCQIYNGRPIDCRLFPFDIRYSKTQNEYMIGYYSEVCKNVPELSQMKKQAHILRPYFFLLYPYLSTFTSENLCPKLSKKESGWIEIAKFKEFVF